MGMLEDLKAIDTEEAAESFMQTNWQHALPKEARENPNVSKYKTSDDFVKGHLSAVERVGKSIIIPDEKATPEERKAFKMKLGVPETADGYTLKAPEKLHAGAQATPEIEKAFKAYVHKHDLTKAQAEGMYPEFLLMASQNIERMEAAQKEKSVAAQTELKGKWGNDYDNNVALATKAAETFFGTELGKTFIDKPEFIEKLHHLGKAISEDMVKVIQGSVPSGDQTVVAAAQKELSAMESEYLTGKGAWANEEDPKHEEALLKVTDLRRKVLGLQ